MRTLVCCLVLAFLILSGSSWGQGSKKSPGGKDEPKTKEGDKKGPGDKTGKPPTLDKLKVPPNTIVIVVDALSNIPKMILMSPKEYQALQDEIAALKSKLKAEKTLPHSCKLTAKVEGNQVSLQAEFAFTTDNPNMTVVLGLQGANLKDEGELWRGQIEKQIPVLDFGPDGYVVQVDKAGSYRLTLNLKLPVGQKRPGTGTGSERVFELGLPGAAVTTLSLDPPSGVKEIRWNDHLETRQEAARLTLGKIKSLNVTWKEPVSLPGTGLLLTADAQITVKVDETQVQTTVDWKLADLRGQPKEEWHLLLPPQAKVEVKGPVGAVVEIVPPEKNKGTTILRLKQPSENLQVLVQVSQPRPKPGTKLPIGPFLLTGAFEQQGKILIKAAPEARRGIRLLFHQGNGIVQREVPVNSAADVLAVFSYDKLPNPGKSPVKSANAWAPLLLEMKPEMGQLETQVEHLVRLSQIAEGWQAELTAKIKGKTLSANVDTLEVQLPRPRPDGLAILASYQGFPGLPWGALYLASQKNWPVTVPAEFQCHGEGGMIPEFRPSSLGRARIQLQGSDAKEFTVVLTGKYLLPAGAWQAGFELPRPLGTRDRGGQVKIVVDDNLELLAGDPAKVEQVPGKQSQSISFDQAPGRVGFSWRPYQPEFPVTGVTDITIHQGNAHLRHVVQLPMAKENLPGKRKGPAPLLFRIPQNIKGLKIDPPEQRKSSKEDKGIAWILPLQEGRANPVVVIEYDLALPPGKGANKLQILSVPLLWPEKATHIDAKIRVWSDPGLIPALANPGLLDSWRDRGTEVVPEKNSLPGLVLHGSGRNLPLTLRLEEGEANLPAVVFDHGLIQVSVREDGAQYYRVRFLVRKLNRDYLDVKLPGSAINSFLEIFLDKNQITSYAPLETDRTTLRVPVKPSLYGRPVFLDLEYLVPVSTAEGERIWQTLLNPPLIDKAVYVAGVRWQFAFPSGVLAIGGLGGGQMDYHWQIRNWLLTPEPTVLNEELQRWQSGSDGARPISLVITRASLEPMRIWHFPRQIWFLVCSGLVLAVGLVLGLSSSRFFFWLTVLAVMAIGIGVGLIWPALLPSFVFGCQPGLVVLIVILGIQWMLQERYRRQVVFMPGFTRLKSNSSLIRSGAGRSREPTTVDVPSASPSVVTGPSKGT